MKYDDYSRKEPKYAKTRLHIKCDNCSKLFWEGRSKYKKKKRHFCSTICYSIFRKTKLPYEEQFAYKGVRKKGESKQIYHKNYCKRHPERIAHLKARRYARESNAEGLHSLEEWENLKKKHKFCCVICGKQKKLTKDHIKPLSLGGTDYISNIQPLCRNCNSRKWKKFYENPELLK